MSHLTPDRLKELLSYDAESGVFTWISSRGNYVKAGRIAGSINPTHGYLGISVDGRVYRAHRLAWLYVHGRWPVDQIDHIDGDKLNNRIANLREATATQQQHNRGLSKRNKSGFKGVYWKRDVRKWHAQIRIAGRIKHLGDFTDLEDAAAAYAAEAAIHHGEFDVQKRRAMNDQGAHT